MRPKSSRTWRVPRNEVQTVVFLWVLLSPAFVVSAPRDAASPSQKTPAVERTGEELFHREWVAGDARSPGGDGLGPVYNETSCVGCHNLGGPGGAGPSTKNAVILTALSTRTPANGKLAGKSTDRKVAGQHLFEASTSVSLHRFGTNPDYEYWRLALLGLKRLPPRRIADERTGNQRFGTDPVDVSAALDSESIARIKALGRPVQIGDVLVATSERSTTPLFGSGLIEAIPDAVIEAVAKERAGSKTFPEIRGRVSRLADGSVGHFGWKGQTASLADFVLTACAVELGLEVPGHHQAPDPLRGDKRVPGLDLSAQECEALTSFVATLPRPIERVPSTEGEIARIAAGRRLFKSIGCGACHQPRLGDVAGLYSDLLLHDMGPSLGGAGSYYTIPADSGDTGSPASGVNRPVARGRNGGAGSQEWRTPPLWGIRDSGPYLHDGRATTLEQAIAIHGGEAEESAQSFAALEPREQAVLVTFLKSLVAPPVTVAVRNLP